MHSVQLAYLPRKSPIKTRLRKLNTCPRVITVTRVQTATIIRHHRHRTPSFARSVPPFSQSACSQSWWSSPSRRHAHTNNSRHAVCSNSPHLQCEQNFVRIKKNYDTTRDAILMCARKPTWVSLIYRTPVMFSVKFSRTAENFNEVSIKFIVRSYISTLNCQILFDYIWFWCHIECEHPVNYYILL